MGGEHYLTFHNNSKSPCDFIHDSNIQNIIFEEKDRIIYKRVRKEIIKLVKQCYFNFENIRKHIDVLPSSFDEKNFKFLYVDLNVDIEKMHVWFHSRDKLYDLFIDICKILCLAFPNKICIYFDRYNSIAQDFIYCYDNSDKFVILKPIVDFTYYEMKDCNPIKQYFVGGNKTKEWDIRKSKYFTNLIYYNHKSINKFDYNYVVHNDVKMSYKTKLILNILSKNLCIDVINLIGLKLFYIVKYN